MRPSDLLAIVLVIPVAILLALALALIVRYNRRLRRRVAEGGARVASELGLQWDGDRATGRRGGVGVHVLWVLRGRGVSVTVCAAWFDPPRAQLVLSTPRPAATTSRVERDLFASERSPEAMRLVRLLEPLLRQPGAEVPDLYNVELDRSTAAIVLRDSIFDAAVLGSALDAARALAEAVRSAEETARRGG
jgi:uncharacterized membrane protein